MRTFLFVTILLLSILTGCETESVPSIQEPSTGNILSRSNDTESLPAGSKILLNANGGLTIENQVFTFDGTIWSDENKYEWGNIQTPTYITALYPLFENKQYDSTNLYDESGLKDILIAQDTISGTTGSELTFRHLFASFTLEVEESLADDIQAISLTSPKMVGSISPTTGNITLSNTSHTTTGLKDENGNYTFIIPPMEGRLKLHITLTSETEPTLYELAYHKFESGFKYECGLKDKNTVPGIRTVGEFIEFCTIINEGTGDLSKYGEEKDGKMLYRLLDDIDLDGRSIYPISSNSNQPFNHIFDGGGHTISNYIAYPYNGYAGLFGFIGTAGIIKNLQISNCSIPTISSGADQGAGILSGRCKGIISNCSITASNITTTQSANTGGITGSLIGGGTIINSSVTNSEFTSTTGPVGAIVGKIENNGYIYNCYSAINTIQNKPNSKNTRGGIVGSVNNGVIQNCYVYNLTFDSRSDNKGQITGRAINSTINYYYYDQDFTRVNNNTNCITTPNYKYNITVVIYTLLNQWITNNQSSYENYTFTTWQEDTSGTLPAIFQ